MLVLCRRCSILRSIFSNPLLITSWNGMELVDCRYVEMRIANVSSVVLNYKTSLVT